MNFEDKNGNKVACTVAEYKELIAEKAKSNVISYTKRNKHNKGSSKLMSWLQARIKYLRDLKKTGRPLSYAKAYKRANKEWLNAKL